jgi:AmmeMemoRadiSam system protein A
MTNVLAPDLRRTPSDSTSPPDIPPHLRHRLLELARAALAVAVGQADPSTLDRAFEVTVDAGEPAAVFVTLTEDGALRGCIGTLVPVRSLRAAVVAATIDAALGDPRFRPVGAGEMPAVHLDISVLSSPVPMADPDVFRPGVEGVIVERDGRQALLLPEVATEWAWGATEMLDAVCEKAGLPSNAWRDRRTQLSSFQTIRFGGPAIPTDQAAPSQATATTAVQ